ncbi:MAG: ATP-dependent zinc metalloprotease FtsH [Planctomycetes bacterium]|nr:ATP-dependent zinc metalloprotease FtsH [Planctomycetota bacterium]
MLIIIAVLFFIYILELPGGPQQWSYTELLQAIDADKLTGVVAIWQSGEITGTYREPSDKENTPPRRFRTVYAPTDKEVSPELRRRLEAKKIEYEFKQPNSLGQNLHWILLILIAVVFWVLIVRQMRRTDTTVMSFGKSKAKITAEKETNTTFEDVAGCQEAKEELQEIIQFLRSPKKFQMLGGKIPKGVLLVGPPGTGKTLIARAIAGEAAVPFFSISGSDFVEMFVGVGAARVRDLFNQAKTKAPCIVFIDEIDAVGRQRFAGIGGGHDEREQTLNQLLVEMDGFESQKGVIIIAATNRHDVLDPALLRPGRFDRRVVVDTPDIKGREEILRVHTKGKPIGRSVDLAVVARQTPGFSGADLANVVNEAALLAARHDASQIEMSDFESAVDRVIAGPERKSRVISDKEKEIVAYHEAGHALVAERMEDADPVHKVSIIPRGYGVGGFTMSLPEEDRYLNTRKELLSRVVVLMGGRAAEELVFKEISTGASNDLEVASNIARAMVCQYGMSEKVGALSFGEHTKQVFLGRDFSRDHAFSQETYQAIDSEVRRIVTECHERAREILRAEETLLHRIADALKVHETLARVDLLAILDGDDVPARRAEAPPEETRRHAPDNAPDKAPDSASPPF